MSGCFIIKAKKKRFLLNQMVCIFLDPNAHFFDGCIKKDVDDDAKHSNNPDLFLFDDVKHAENDEESNSGWTNDFVKKGMVFKKRCKGSHMK